MRRLAAGLAVVGMIALPAQANTKRHHFAYPSLRGLVSVHHHKTWRSRRHPMDPLRALMLPALTASDITPKTRCNAVLDYQHQDIVRHDRRSTFRTELHLAELETIMRREMEKQGVMAPLAKHPASDVNKAFWTLTRSIISNCSSDGHQQVQEAAAQGVTHLKQVQEI